MPTVLRVGGFRVAIFLPSREHGPPHVHVFRGGGEVVIELANSVQAQAVRTVGRVRTADVATAFAMVEMHSSYLLARWRQYHG